MVMQLMQGFISLRKNPNTILCLGENMYAFFNISVENFSQGGSINNKHIKFGKEFMVILLLPLIEIYKLNLKLSSLLHNLLPRKV